MRSEPDKRKPTKRRGSNQTADQVVADQVRSLRARRGITQQELADALDWPQSTVARLELGRRAISISDLLALSWALDVAPVYLLDGGFTNGDVPVHATLRIPTKHARAWIRGSEPLPGSDYRAYFENIPDDEWHESYGPLARQRAQAAAQYEQAEELLASGATRRPGREDQALSAEHEAELAEEREQRKAQLDAVRHTKQPRKRKAADG